MYQSAVLLASFLIYFSSALCQSPFRMTYNLGTPSQYAFGINETASGGYILSGDAGTLLKTNALGYTEWVNEYQHTSGNETNYCVCVTNDGGFVFGGNGAFGSQITKTDSIGNPQWALESAVSSFPTKVVSIKEHNSGKLFFQDFCTGSSPAFNTMNFGCLGSNGNVLWTKKIEGAGDELGDDLTFTSDGNIIFIGSTTTFGTGNMDIQLVKTDTSGTILWTKTYGGVNHDFGHCVKETTDGGLIILGHTESFGTGDWDVFIVRTDAVGDTLWSKACGTVNRDEGHELLVENDGFVFTMEDRTTQEVSLIKINTSGDYLWGKTYPGFYFYEWMNNGFIKTSDGGYALLGMDNGKMHLIKTDDQGYSGCTDLNKTVDIIPVAPGISSGYTLSPGLAYNSNPATFITKTSADSIACSNGPASTTLTLTKDEKPDIFPNPAIDFITINYNADIDATVALYSITGNLIYESSFRKSLVIPVSNYEKGIYYMLIKSEEGVGSEKIIIN